jgi:hypothetical protein
VKSPLLLVLKAIPSQRLWPLKMPAPKSTLVMKRPLVTGIASASTKLPICAPPLGALDREN